MKVTVTTPAGNIGRVVASALLDAGVEVVLPVRDPAKVRDLGARGAKVVKGSLDDASFLTEACRGSDAIFWLTPPDLSAADFRGWQNRLGRAAAAAIRTSGVPRVVNLSSIGAQHAQGTGPIKGLHDVEGHLNDTRASVLHLRPAFFMENFLRSLATIRESGSILMPVRASARTPMIATRDIAAFAADRLRDTSWSGRSIADLLGPADLTFGEAATIISEGIGRHVKHVTIEEDVMRRALKGLGASDDAAGTMLELYRAIDAGRLAPDKPRSAASTTPTTLLWFAREVVKPALG